VDDDSLVPDDAEARESFHLARHGCMYGVLIDNIIVDHSRSIRKMRWTSNIFAPPFTEKNGEREHRFSVLAYEF